MSAQTAVQVFNHGALQVVSGANPVGSHLRCDSKADYELVARHAVGWRQDAGLTAAFARQLEHVFAKTYAAEYAQYRAHEFFPTSTEVDPGALSFTYRMVNRVGQAAVINAGNARDLPNVGLEAQEWQSPVITIGASYNFTVVNQASAAMANFALEAEKAKATREAIEGLEEQVYAQGFSPAGVPGVTNALGVVGTPQTSTGTWTTQLLAGLAASPLSSAVVTAMVGDILAAKARIFNTSLGRHKATNCLLPPNLYSMLDTAPESPLFNSKTILQWMEEVTGLDFDYWPILLNAGAIAGSPLNFAVVSGGNPQQNTRVIVYEKNPDVVQLIQAQSFIQLSPQPVGMVWEVNCFSRIGGAMAVRPIGITYIDGL
jgi:hypothetical protein